METKLGNGKFGNDVNWYKHYPELTENVARLFMSRPNGVDYPFTNFTKHAEPIHDELLGKQGGFLGILTMPTYGATGDIRHIRDVDASASLNLAASKLYYYVVHGNSRNISYDKSDLIKTYVAFDGIACVITEAIRAYHFVKAVSVRNRWAKKIVQCLGWDYNNLNTNLVLFKKMINLAILKFNQISLPDVFDIYHCHKELYEKVYMDRSNGKPQFIAAISDGLWAFSDGYSELKFMTEGVINNGAAFKWSPKKGLRTVYDFEAAVNSMLNAIYDSTDIGVMQGDLKRAFGENQMISLSPITEESEIPLTYDEEFNLCVHNLEMIPAPLEVTTKDDPTAEVALSYETARIIDDANVSGNLDFAIFGATGAVKLGWSSTGTVGTESDTHVIDLPDEWTEDIDAILMAHKFKCEGYSTTGKIHMQEEATTSLYRLTSCGPFVVTEMRYIYNIDDELNLYRAAPYSGIGGMVIITNNHTYRQAASALFTKLSELHITLPVWVAGYDEATQTYIADGYLQEVGNMVVYDSNVMQWIQKSMMESLWYNSMLYNRS